MKRSIDMRRFLFGALVLVPVLGLAGFSVGFLGVWMLLPHPPRHRVPARAQPPRRGHGGDERSTERGGDAIIAKQIAQE